MWPQCSGESQRLLAAQANPTCNSGTYSGGLSCCVHGRILLDTAQERRPELLRYHMKFRFWYQVRRSTPQRLQGSEAARPIQAPGHCAGNGTALSWPTGAKPGEVKEQPSGRS